MFTFQCLFNHIKLLVAGNCVFINKGLNKTFIEEKEERIIETNFSC